MDSFNLVKLNNKVEKINLNEIMLNNNKNYQSNSILKN